MRETGKKPRLDSVSILAHHLRSSLSCWISLRVRIQSDKSKASALWRFIYRPWLPPWSSPEKPSPKQQRAKILTLAGWRTRFSSIWYASILNKSLDYRFHQNEFAQSRAAPAGGHRRRQSVSRFATIA